MKTIDPIKLVAAVNPLPAAAVAGLDDAPECAIIRARVDAGRAAKPARAEFRHSSLRPVALAIAVAVILAVPALALSGALGDLFGFSNQGTPVDESSIDLNSASALKVTGVAPGTVKLLASRDGVGIYAAGSVDGNLCYFLGGPQRPDENGLSGGCLNASASARFPSPAQPVVDMTAFVYKPGADGETITRLAGVAADGVAKVQVLGVDCQVIATTPVNDNVYVDSSVPDFPAVAIRALDDNGKQVYLEKLRFWDKSACAAGGK